MWVSKVLDSIFGVHKTLGLIFRGQQRNVGIGVRENPHGLRSLIEFGIINSYRIVKD